MSTDRHPRRLSDLRPDDAPWAGDPKIEEVLRREAVWAQPPADLEQRIRTEIANSPLETVERPSVTAHLAHPDTLDHECSEVDLPHRRPDEV